MGDESTITLNENDITMLAESTVIENLKIYKKLFLQYYFKGNPQLELSYKELILIRDYTGGTYEELQVYRENVRMILKKMKES